MSYEEKYNAVKECLENLESEWQAEVWNEYQRANYYEDEIYSMGEFDELMCGKNPSEIVGMLEDGFSIMDEWFVFTIYGVKSLDYPDRVIEFDELAEWVLDGEKDCGNNDLQELFEEFSEDEAEDDEDDEEYEQYYDGLALEE